MPNSSHFTPQELSIRETAKQLSTSIENGLSPTEAQSRLEGYGPNRLFAEKKESFWEEFFEELREPMVLLLLFTGVLYAIWSEISDAITIFVIILALNAIEVVNEQRAKKAISGLRKLAEPTALVCRDGICQEIPVEQIVPGDRILLQDGRRVPADARLVESYGLAVDESSLTGESLPVEKDPLLIFPSDAPLADRRNMVYSGTLVTRGRGTAIVTATGMSSEIGRVAGLARQVKEPRTPLQKAMSELSGSLVWLALGFSVIVPLLGILISHQPLKTMLLTGLSLAFATIPEEMPIIITMVLALGAYRLSRQHAIVKRLKAVETLGAVTIIATDKTGTLTRNRMEVSRLEPQDQAGQMLELGALCNNALPSGDDFTGDPLDAALLRAARAHDIDPQALRTSHPLCNEFTFDNTRKRMSVIYQDGEQYCAVVKGAPEAVLPLCIAVQSMQGNYPLDAAGREALTQQTLQMAGQRLRVLALAKKALDRYTVQPANMTQAEVESDLTFVGLVGLADPPRPEARQAVDDCRKAGIRTIMVTGDHPLTAQTIAREVGLVNQDEKDTVLTGPDLDRFSDAEVEKAVRSVSIFARTTPENKLRIVQALEKMGERVAVTGDGINDAPALVAADIGVAMGETGTDVAREAGDIILADDNFATIVKAVEEGRLLFENLRKGVRYYLACKVALVLATLLPVLLLVPVPFAPVQIILMELFMDLAAAAAFVAEPAESDLLGRPPRDPQARFMDRAMVTSIFTTAVGLFAAVSLSYLVTWYTTHSLPTAQTVAFFAWLIGHVLLAFNLRSNRQPVLQHGLANNRLMLYWGAAVVVFLALVALLPPIRQVLKVTLLSPEQWALILIATFTGTFWIEVRKWLNRSSS